MSRGTCLWCEMILHTGESVSAQLQERQSARGSPVARHDPNCKLYSIVPMG